MFGMRAKNTQLVVSCDCRGTEILEMLINLFARVKQLLYKGF